ncbi:MAG: trypsin-like peptidase domain-containing protein [Gammaproteobacteria bacterium]|nr:trypsin-like peptidase domain-containing protein [Gammaproteobacteria bacterium]
MRFNRELDLAAILVNPNGKGVTTAIFSDEVSQLGASLIAGGFPLSTLMDNDFTVVFGKVTGRRGIGGNSNLFSISLPVQPGNSGGPLVNSDGEVTGVIVGKLDDGIMLEAAGTTGANFGFAISGIIARDFISPFKIQVNNELSVVE